MLRSAGFVVGTVFTFLLLIVLTQDLQIYAQMMIQLTGGGSAYSPPEAGDRAADGFAVTTDGRRIHFRRWAPAGESRWKLRTAILSHGNAGTMDRYRTIPKWLAGNGVATYVYDYRGYGQSTGWPSEQGIYRDIEAIWREARQRDNAAPETTLAFGHSLGGGPATYLAEKHNLGVLLIAASYTSVPDRAALHPYFSRLAPFVWTIFPNRERIGRLRDTCLIVLHGHNDDTMPPAMAARLRDAYKGNAKALLAEHPTAGHGDIIGQVPRMAEPLLGPAGCRIDQPT